ncbi:hypothetical protein CI1B_53340 [Bradyrhizobium ivorense]|uniref:Uncharacterized protein n=1 Tax=Bradyrhizobium ivorense TaxID=2511166 RepID=A0A508TJL9_9BRAD|nr:hypothetical protein [Bradyrhizobium ivorense]VIO74561.1 hypothetical protein CI1B_53340 [Bradyrhizobium ivorense]
MWKRLWLTWTIDKPAALGDLLWQVLVVDFAALLDRLTLRRIIALIPLVLVIAAYVHRIPVPPELMLVGDLFAYIDVFSMVFLIGLLTRMSTVLVVVKQAVDLARRLLQRVPGTLRRLDLRHRRAKDSTRRKHLGRATTDDDDGAVMPGLAWA